jgi:hypothetical protein
MSQTFNTKELGKPRHHKRTATGYIPEVDEKGEEKWPRGDEATWKAGLKGVDTSESTFSEPAITGMGHRSIRSCPQSSVLGASVIPRITSLTIVLFMQPSIPSQRPSCKSHSIRWVYHD